MTDQQRYDQVGYAGRGGFDTPVLDDLARRGVVFENAYSSSTTCVPARVGFLTGCLPHRVPTQVNGLALEEGFWTLAHHLRAVGYQTALVGKMHFFPTRAEHGFDVMRLCEHLDEDDFYADGRAREDRADDYHRWLVDQGRRDWRADAPVTALAPDGPLFPYPAEAHPTSWVADEAVSVLRRRRPDQPLLLVVSFPHPHTPYNPPEPYASMYDPEDMPVPDDDPEVNGGLPPAFVHALTDRTQAFRPMARPGRPEVLQVLLTIIRALVRHIDDAMGQVLAEVDPSRTLIATTSDHGDYAGHRGLVRKVPWIPFEDLARVPLVVSAPDAVPGRRTGLVQSSDLALTALDYAGALDGLDLDEFDSRSLRPLVRDPAGQEPETAVLCATSVGWPTIRRGALKLITRGPGGRGREVLFDLAADPDERVDLAGDPRHRAELDSLRAELGAVMSRGRPGLPRFG
jgi:arylsulfatase A-like enzyme